jgi:hypothetical protein
LQIYGTKRGAIGCSAPAHVGKGSYTSMLHIFLQLQDLVSDSICFVVPADAPRWLRCWIPMISNYGYVYNSSEIIEVFFDSATVGQKPHLKIKISLKNKT